LKPIPHIQIWFSKTFGNSEALDRLMHNQWTNQQRGCYITPSRLQTSR
jgi:hypothetical protein